MLPEGYEHEGIGFYVMRDDGEISLEDTSRRSGHLQPQLLINRLPRPEPQPVTPTLTNPYPLPFRPNPHAIPSSKPLIQALSPNP